MDEIIPWAAWGRMIQPFYPSGKRGWPTRGIETMLRMYLMQVWFSLSDEGIEDAIYDSYAMRTFMKINFTTEQVPDATTLLNRAGLLMHGGTVVDATLVEAPSSTKNETGERDPEMHQTKKGNQWHFGMKVHAGVDAGMGYVHTITGTAANVHDSVETPKLLCPDDTVVYGDSGYLGVQKQEAVQNDEHLSQIDFRINKRPSSLKTDKKFAGIHWERRIEHRKSSVRSKVEHIFLIVKRDFGYRKTVYRGLAKNMHRFHLLFGLANLLMCVRAGQKQRFCEG